MKKIVSIVLILLLVAGLAFCSFSKSSSTTPTEDNTQEAIEQETQEEVEKQEEVIEVVHQEETKEEEKEEPKKEIDDDILKTYKYWVVFFNEDGSEIQREAIKWGTVPTYWSDTPYYEDGEHRYRFIGWTDRWGRDVKEFKPITGNTRFYAKYEIGGDVHHGGGGSPAVNPYHVQISSLTSVPGAYINSKLQAADNMEFVFDAKLTAANGCRCFGYWTSHNPDDGFLFQSNSSGQLQYYCGNGQELFSVSGTMNQKATYDIKYSGSNSFIKVNGTTHKNFTTGSIDETKDIYIFALNDGSPTSNDKMPLTIYYMKIYKEGSLVRDFIPVRIIKEVDKTMNAADSSSNIPVGTVCFYDKTNNLYYPSSGNKSFTDRTDHIEVQCLTSPSNTNNSGPFIDTNVTAKDNMRFVYKVKMKFGVGSNPFGYYVSYSPYNGLGAHPYYNGTQNYGYEIYFGNSVQYATLTNEGLDKETVFEFQLKAGDNYLKADGATIYSDSSTYSPYPNNSIYIMAEKHPYGIVKSSSFSIYYFQMYVDDILVGDYIPVYTVSTIDKTKNATNLNADIPPETLCMYDKVTQKYFVNSGSGLFTDTPVN